jgi:hypothetical protein
MCGGGKPKTLIQNMHNNTNNKYHILEFVYQPDAKWL